MKIEGLSYSEFALIRQCIQEHKEIEWKSLMKRARNNISFDIIKECRKEFDENVNQFYLEGLCNKVLIKLDKVEVEAQKELGMIE